MATETLWQTIESEIDRYNALKLDERVDYKKFYLYSLITHSTAIEGSTLTEEETCLLFDDGITAKGKPLTHHLMNEDLKNAYLFAIDNAVQKTAPTVDFLRKLNALVMKSTGSIVNAMGGTFDSGKGEFRLCNVTAGPSGTSYLNYTKISDEMSKLSAVLQNKIGTEKKREAIYTFSFDAHFNMVTIHPWVDGNGRAARLLMNYIQFYNQIIPVKVFKEDKAEYIAALVESRNTADTSPFRFFMAKQLLKLLKEEIAHSTKNQAEKAKLLF
jgi:Fic family protein